MLQAGNLFLLPCDLSTHWFHGLLLFDRYWALERLIETLFLMLEAQLTVASLNIHGLVMCKLHCFPINEVFFPLYCPFALDCIYFCSLIFFLFASLDSSFLSLLFCTLGVHPFLNHFLLNFLLELLLPLFKRLFPFHGFLNCLLRFNSIINFLFGLFFSLLQDIDPSEDSVIWFESLR